jgi:hypothetical protein
LLSKCDKMKKPTLHWIHRQVISSSWFLGDLCYTEYSLSQNICKWLTPSVPALLGSIYLNAQPRVFKSQGRLKHPLGNKTYIKGHQEGPREPGRIDTELNTAFGLCWWC